MTPSNSLRVPTIVEAIARPEPRRRPRGLRHDPVRDSALRAEAANLLEVHVVQFLEEPRVLGGSCDRKFDIHADDKAGGRMPTATQSIGPRVE
jgi:hypothetical protein